MLTIRNIKNICLWQITRPHAVAITFKKVYVTKDAYRIECLTDHGWAGLLSNAGNFTKSDITIDRHNREVKHDGKTIAVELTTLDWFLYTFGKAEFGCDFDIKL